MGGPNVRDFLAKGCDGTNKKSLKSRKINVTEVVKKRFDFWLSFATLLYVANLFGWMLWFIFYARGEG